MNSPGHNAIVLSTTLNYVGVGLAVDAATGKKLWTAVYIKGPDRTGARATHEHADGRRRRHDATPRVTVGWTGADVRLQVLTSGSNYCQVQRRTDGGGVDDGRTSTTTKPSLTLRARRRPYLRVPDRRPRQGRQLGRLVDGPVIDLR